MMKNQLYIKCSNYDFKSLFEKKGYAWFDNGLYNLNIIGVRRNMNNKVTNTFDDILVVDYYVANSHKRQCYNITTEPGTYYMHNPLVKSGTAILVPNQYRGCWKIGLHQGKYKALCQAKPVKVYRDGNKDDIYDLDPNTTEEGMFGINIHRSSINKLNTTIDKWSAGCQVFNDPTAFNAFIRLCEMQKEKYGNSFTYTLLNETDL